MQALVFEEDFSKDFLKTSFLTMYYFLGFIELAREASHIIVAAVMSLYARLRPKQNLPARPKVFGQVVRAEVLVRQAVPETKFACSDRGPAIKDPSVFWSGCAG